MQEPESGYLICGQRGDQQVYERDDEEAAEVAAKQPGYTLEHRWFHVADGTDIYRFEDLLRDYGPENVVRLVADWRDEAWNSPLGPK